MTASTDRRVKREALELGATDFLNKPVNSAELVARVRNALAVKAYQDYLKNYAQELNRQVYLRTADLAGSRLELVHCLSRAIEYRNDEVPLRAVRVGRYAGIIARQAGENEQFVELIEHAAPLRDIGMLALPDPILRKSGKLTPEEFEMMQRMPPDGRHHFEQMSPDQWQVFKEHTSLGKTLFGGGKLTRHGDGGPDCLDAPRKLGRNGLSPGALRRTDSAARPYHGGGRRL